MRKRTNFVNDGVSTTHVHMEILLRSFFASIDSLLKCRFAIKLISMRFSGVKPSSSLAGVTVDGDGRGDARGLIAEVSGSRRGIAGGLMFARHLP